MCSKLELLFSIANQEFGNSVAHIQQSTPNSLFKTTESALPTTETFTEIRHDRTHILDFLEAVAYFLYNCCISRQEKEI